LTHQIAILLHLVAESCTICSSRSRRPVRKLLDTPCTSGSAHCSTWFWYNEPSIDTKPYRIYVPEWRTI